MSTELDNEVGVLVESIETWRINLIQYSSYAVRVLVAKRPGSNFDGADLFTYGSSLADDPKGRDYGWFLENVAGKERICLESDMDSHEAVRTWPGLLKDLDGAFPWGGGIIDLHYGLVVCTSGFKELEDVLVSRTVRNFIVMRWDMDGEAHLEDARKRGARKGAAGADRFTRTVGGVYVPNTSPGLHGAWTESPVSDDAGLGTPPGGYDAN